MGMKRKHIGRNIHKQILKKVLQAPVNIFFDVTPIGKISSIFNGDLEVFYGRLLDPLHGIFEISSHVLVVISSYYAIGNFSVTVMTFIVMLYIMSKISKPYLSADN